MKLYTEERFLLQKLLKDKKFDIYLVYRETMYSSAQIVRFLKTYYRKLYIIRIGRTIYITPIGYYKIKKMNFLARKEDMYWKEIPEDIKSDITCNINEIPQDIGLNRRVANRIFSNKG